MRIVKHKAISEITKKEVEGYVCYFDEKLFSDEENDKLNCFILWDGKQWHRVSQETIRPIL